MLPYCDGYIGDYNFDNGLYPVIARLWAFHTSPPITYKLNTAVGRSRPADSGINRVARSSFVHAH
jgi:hypothetical protein